MSVEEVLEDSGLALATESDVERWDFYTTSLAVNDSSPQIHASGYSGATPGTDTLPLDGNNVTPDVSDKDGRSQVACREKKHDINDNPEAFYHAYRNSV